MASCSFMNRAYQSKAIIIIIKQLKIVVIITINIALINLIIINSIAISDHGTTTSAEQRDWHPRVSTTIIRRFCSIHSFIQDIYIAPLQETYSEALSVQLRSKRNVLRSLQKEDTLFLGSKRSVRGSSFQVEGANNRESSTLFKRCCG